METKDYIKQLASKEYEGKLIEIPLELPEDFKQLVNGLTTMNKLSYDYIKTNKQPTMKELNCAGTNIQFATSQLIATYNAYYDLINKIKAHNEKVEEKKA